MGRQIFGRNDIRNIGRCIHAIGTTVPFHDQPVLRRNWYHDLSFRVFNRPVIYAGAILMFSVALFARNQVVPEAVVTSVGELPLWRRATGDSGGRPDLLRRPPRIPHLPGDVAVPCGSPQHPRHGLAGGGSSPPR